MNLIYVVVDRLHSGMIGAYGNSWIRTEHLDRLACQSFLFDQALVDSPQLDRLYRAYWFGLHAHSREPIERGAGLINHLTGAQFHTALLTDEPAIKSFAGADDFAEFITVDAPAVQRAADEIAETQMARLFSAASRWLREAPRPFCLWIHARGMSGPWDAPLEMRNSYADGEDPEPPKLVVPPELMLGDDYDPDMLLGIVHAYAGQVSLLDQCVGALLDDLEELGLESTTQFNLLSARGYPLGEHLRVGPCDEPVYTETAAIVWMMRFPDRLGQLARSSALVQPADLPSTAADWLGLNRTDMATLRASSLLPIVRGEVDTNRPIAHMISGGEQALRTAAWMFRRPAAGAAELYAKPGDRWEVNEISKLCPEVISGFEAVLAQVDASPDVAPSGELADELVTIVD
jgi:arylsulfatase A-like enzyme